MAFDDKYHNTVVGTIVRIKQRTAAIDSSDGSSWHVELGLHRHVLDI